MTTNTGQLIGTAALAAAVIILVVMCAAIIFMFSGGCSWAELVCVSAAYVLMSSSALIGMFFTLGATGLLLRRANTQKNQPASRSALWACPAWALAFCIGVAATNNPFHYTTTQWMDWWLAVVLVVPLWALAVGLALRQGRASGLLAIASGLMAIGFAGAPFAWVTGMLVW